MAPASSRMEAIRAVPAPSFQMGDLLAKEGFCTVDEFLEAVNTHDFDVRRVPSPSPV